MTSREMIYPSSIMLALNRDFVYNLHYYARRTVKASFAHPLPNIRLMVDVVIFTIADGQLKVLLVKRTNEPFLDQPALPGGYLQEGEVSLETAERVLRDKAGVSGVYMEQLYTFDAPDRDPRGRHISVVYVALAPEEQLKDHQAMLCAIDSLPKLAFDHAEMIEYARKRLQAKLEYTNVAFSLLPRLFTLSELQQTYEIILARVLDKRNFQKKFLSLGLIEPTSGQTKGGQHRPARLYHFKNHRPTELKKFF